MRVDVLGPLRVSADGDDVTPRGQRPRGVLTVLLQRRGHAVSPELILDLVWAEEAVRLSAGAVHTVIARLRRAMGADLILTRDTGYQLSDRVGTDVEVFDEHLRRAQEARTAGRTRESASSYRSALAQWRGPVAFAGVGDDLVVADRARLDERRSGALEELVATLLDHTEPGSAPEEALRLATDLAHQHPLRERPHRLAMLAAYRSGRQAEALEMHHSLAVRLRTELGIDPEPATAHLHARMLAQDPALSAPSRVPRLRRPPAPEPADNRMLRTAPLPVPLTALVGREEEVAAVLGALDGGRRLVTIVGPGGVGKSRLLAEVHGRLREVQHLHHLDLAAVGQVDVDELAEAVALAHGIATTPDDPVGSLATALRRADATVLVDQADRTLGPVAALLTRLLAGCPQLRFVVTSRSPLEVTGEHRLPLAPLACPPEDSPDPASFAAVRLLRDRILDHAPGPMDRAQDAQDLARIARRVDGLPLALELVAGHAASRTLAELVELVESPLDVPAAEPDRAARHRSLRDTILWSASGLDPDQRRVLRRLGVFAGPFDTAAATAVVGPVEGDLAATLRGLARDALVQVERGGCQVRFRLLRTVRDLALEGLAQTGELDGARRRHREWYAARWRDAPLQDALVQDVGDSYDDYLEALRTALAASDPTTAGDLVIALFRRWQFVEAVAPGLRWLERALSSGVLSPHDRARALLAHTALLQQIAPLTDPQRLDEAAASLAQDADWYPMSLMVRCIEQYKVGDFVAAERTAADTVHGARDRAPHHLPESLAMHAAALSTVDRMSEALATAEESWSLISAAPAAVHFVSVVPTLALALTDCGQPRRALDVLETAIAEVGDRLGLEPTPTMRLNAGWAALGCGEAARALEWFVRTLTDPTRAPQGDVLAECLCGAGSALAALDDPAAEPVLTGALELCRRHGLVLSPWQRRQVPAPEPPSEPDPLPESDTALGQRLTILVVDRAAGRPGSAAQQGAHHHGEEQRPSAEHTPPQQ